MAVQFPNFLGVPIQKPDYSGLSDIFQNYYGGKALKQNDTINQSKVKEAPLDLLLKQIQAEFARPNAETALSGAKLGNQGKSLSNRSTQLSNRQAEMTLQKLQQELRNQAEVEASVKAALAKGGASSGMASGGGFGGGMMPSPTQSPPVMGSTPMNSSPMAQSMPGGAEGVRQQQNGTALQKGLMEVMQHQAMKNQEMPTQAPILEEHPAERMNDSKSQTKVIETERGTPALYGLDEMWETKPQLRPYIEKHYGKKEVKDQYDKKTGMNIVRTKWPSGRITVKTMMPEVEDTGNEVPLTKPGMVKVENEIRGTDALLPYLDELIELSKPQKVVEGVETSKLPYLADIFGFQAPGNASATYHKTVNKALESYAAASKLPSTDKSIEKVHNILSRAPGESDRHYHEELIRERDAQLKKRARNLITMKKGLNKFGNTGSDESYSSNEWEMTNEK